jgi:hypothetical protein
MTECQSASGEFSGWSRVATDFLVHELTDILLRTALRGYGGAVPRKDWDELIKGDLLALHGDAEGRCVRNVYVYSINWAEVRAGGTSISYVFDDRPHRNNDNSLIFDIFRSLHDDASTARQAALLRGGIRSACYPRSSYFFRSGGRRPARNPLGQCRRTFWRGPEPCRSLRRPRDTSKGLRHAFGNPCSVREQ